ncbi:unnamed protein product [Angiostrongylus costaricensis]|uniref:WH1 domain-containing protein n=1 Tax=Angiostrongylus costaricensis TaxID=334426 RepID=A0A158PM15_ANGCS|nr:unnamed protein product [Angiostrongylus costaricensis]
MTIDIRNGTNHIPDAPTTRIARENRISPYLTESERQSILTYLEPSAKALCTGVCQLLQAEDNVWKDTKVGVICFIRNPQIKEYVLSLLLPKPSGTSAAKVLWTMTVSAFFETEKTSDEHLLIFVMDSFPRDVCGLHFYDPREADEFHRILVIENRNRITRRASIPKRHAPPPPQAGGCEVVEQLTEPSGALTINSGEKKHKKGFLGGIFTMKKKKKDRKKLDISAPMEFKHIEHLGLEELSVEDQETFHHLVKEVDIQPGNEAQMQLIREIIATRGSEIRSSMRLKRNSVHPSESFGRGPHKTLAESRDSMMVLHKQQRRTPREVKKGSTTKVNTGQEIPIDRYLDPDWEKTPLFESQKKLHVITEYNESESSVIFKIGTCGYGKSLPRDSLPPRIPDRKQSGSATKPIWRIEVPLPNGAQVPQHSPPPTPPSSQPSPVQSTNEPSLTFPQNNHSVTTSVPSEISTSALPPPPPPPSLLSPAPTPPPCSELKQPVFDIPPFNTNGRKSLLESPTGDGGLLSAIQAELDKRREYIVTDSDCEADSTDSEWTD